jgi:hypothetical protein
MHKPIIKSKKINKKSSTGKRYITIRVDAKLYNKLVRKMRKHDASMTAVIIAMIEHGLTSN